MTVPRPVILAGYDGSATADAAIRQGMWLAPRLRAELVGLVVRERTPSSIAEPKPWTGKSVDRVLGRFSKVTSMEDGTESYRCEVVRGAAGPAILQAAASMKARWILLGTHGLTGMDRIMLGSVAEHVLTHATRPVIVQSSRKKHVRWLADPADQLRRILLGVDENAFMPLIAEEAFHLARAIGARVTAFHAVSPGASAGAAESAGRKALKPVVSMAKGQGIPIETRIGRAAPDEAMVAVAAELPAALIVVGTHGRTGLARIMLGSVSTAIVRSAACPVVVVPRTAEQVGGGGPAEDDAEEERAGHGPWIEEHARRDDRRKR